MITLAVFVVYAQLTASHFLGDAYVYLGAGERLNVGHQLYSLSPGDRPIPIQPPFWTAPLVSPPLIAVLWRPLAALPNEAGVIVWWISSLLALGGSILYIVRRHPLGAGLALVALSVPVAMEAGLGNVNAFLLAGTIAVWHWRRSTVGGRDFGRDDRGEALAGRARGVAGVRRHAQVARCPHRHARRVRHRESGRGRLGESRCVPVRRPERSSLGVQPHVAAWHPVAVAGQRRHRDRPRRGHPRPTGMVVPDRRRDDGPGSPVANPNTYAQLLAIFAPARTKDRTPTDPEENAVSSL